MKYEKQNKYNERQNTSKLVVTQYISVGKIGETVQKAQRYTLKKNRSSGLKYSMWYTANDIYLLTWYND